MLGNALSIWKPVDEFVREFAIDLMSHVEHVYSADGLPAPIWSDLVKSYPGKCFLGTSKELPQGITLDEVKHWVRDEKTLMREILSKIYPLLDMTGNEPWMHTTDKYGADSGELRDNILSRFNDPLSYLPRFRMPLKQNGMSWIDLQKSTLPTRNYIDETELGKVFGGGLNTIHLKNLEPPMSDDEAMAMERCEMDFKHHFGTEPRGLPFTSGKFEYLTPQNSAFGQLGTATGLPVTAGVSGTVNIFVAAAEMLYDHDGGSEVGEKGSAGYKMHMMRLAMLAWNLPTQDHTMLEVMTAASRTFRGRSYPDWCDGDACSPATDSTWRDIYKNLLPKSSLLNELHSHIEDYMQGMPGRMEQMSRSPSHVGPVRWPGESKDHENWHTHEYFSYVMDDIFSRRDDLTTSTNGIMSENLKCSDARILRPKHSDD